MPRMIACSKSLLWRRHARAAGEAVGPLLTQHALALAAVLLKDERERDVVARACDRLGGAALLETLKVLPEELEEMSMAVTYDEGMAAHQLRLCVRRGAQLLPQTEDANCHALSMLIVRPHA